ncbi:MAG: hypothetical protein ABFE13_25785 [Phycisphaerales bacterium]
MPTIINRDEVPDHLFNIPELDFSTDLFAQRPDGPWFRLGAWTIASQCDTRDVVDVVDRQSLLLAPGRFGEVFDDLGSIGNVIHDMGKPGSSLYYGESEKKEYRYTPFHQFTFGPTSAVGEPLVFARGTTSGTHLLVNPDLWLFFELEEKTCGNGIWWDPQRGVEAVVRRVIEQGNLEVVDIRVDYLLRYLKVRQMSLIVAHYRHLHLFDPKESTAEAFVEGDIVLGAPEQGAKALLQNCRIRGDILGGAPFLQRRLHLWFEINPPDIDMEDPWAEQPPFDPYTFTLPTSSGPVAPARWRHFPHTQGRTFDGQECDFMSRVCFRQEVLMKYEGKSGFDVRDDGSVSCHDYWGLVRSTARIGNELLSTAIGDFAEGLPFDEWPHWKQYAVEPPSLESIHAIRQEQSVAQAVNSLTQALARLNDAFVGVESSVGVTPPGCLWRGSLDSLAGRQLKWVYPVTADDDEFLKRATLVSTLVLDGLNTPTLRELLCHMGKKLHMSNDHPPKELGSRNLLRRVSLIGVLVAELRPRLSRIPTLVCQAEGKSETAKPCDLRMELEAVYRRVQDEFSPLAFLYDLRLHGGLAHAPNRDQAAKAAIQLGLAPRNWHRTDYLRVLNLVTESIEGISRHLETGAYVLRGSGVTGHDRGTE